MANIRINALPLEASPVKSDVLAIDGASTRKTTIEAAVLAGRPAASQAEAEAGTEPVKAMTPLTTKQAIAAQGAVLFATAAQGAKADSAVQPALTISAGAGLTGGGTLAANRTLALDSTSIASLALADSAVQPAAMAAYAAPIGRAVPIGGASTQVLVKLSNADNDVGWTAAGAGDVTLTGVQTLTNKTLASPNISGTLNGGPLSGFRNAIINGAGAVNQRQATTAADDTYAHDRHYALTQTAAIGVSTLTAPADGIAAMIRLTQTQVTAQRFGYAQIVEAVETYGKRGKLVTLGGKLRYSNAAPVRYAILEWTGTADAVTSDVVNSWTNGTFTAGQFFNSTTLTVRQVGTITPTAAVITDWSTSAIIGTSANNIIVFYWTEGTAAQGSTLDQRWYLVDGGAGDSDPFSARQHQQELALCQRYYFEMRYVNCGGYANGNLGSTQQFPVEMRVTPSAAKVGTWFVSNCTQPVLALENGSRTAVMVYATSTTAGQTQFASAIAGNAITLDAEL